MKAYVRVIFERTDGYHGINIIRSDIFPLDFVTNENYDPEGWAREEVSMLKWADLKEYAEKAVANPDADDYVYELYGLMELESYQSNSYFDPLEYATTLYFNDVYVKVLSNKEIDLHLTDRPAPLTQEERDTFDQLVKGEEDE